MSGLGSRIACGLFGSPRIVIQTDGLGVGSADLVGCYRGRFVAIECKAPDGRVSEAQECWGRAVTRVGGLYLLARAGTDSVQDVVARVTQPGVGLVGLP